VDLSSYFWMLFGLVCRNNHSLLFGFELRAGNAAFFCSFSVWVIPAPGFVEWSFGVGIDGVSYAR